MKRIIVNHLLIFFGAAALALGQSCYYHSASEVILADMGKIYRSKTHRTDYEMQIAKVQAKHQDIKFQDIY